MKSNLTLSHFSTHYTIYTTCFVITLLSILLLAGGAIAGELVAVTGSNGKASTIASISPPTLTSIIVSPSTTTVVDGKTQAFTAKDQNKNDITTKVTWSSSDKSVGIIDQSGVFTALKAGTITVEATSGNVSGSAIVNVVEDFTFAHLTDIHIGFNRIPLVEMRSSTERFTDTLQAVKNVNPDRILITGDLVEWDNKDFFIAFKNLLKNISIPVNTTPGNHDRGDEIPFGSDLSNYNNIINLLNNPSNINDDNYSFDFKGYRFIGLDSGSTFNAGREERSFGEMGLDLGPESDGLSNDQINRLKGEFNSSSPKILFMHHPVISSQDDYWGQDKVRPPNPVPNDCHQYGGNDNSIAFNRCNFINYSKDDNVQLVLTGHSHQDWIFDTTGNQATSKSSNRPLFIQTRSATRDEGDNFIYGYRIIKVKDGIANPSNPYYSDPTPRFNRITGEFQSNLGQAKHRFGLNAYASRLDEQTDQCPEGQWSDELRAEDTEAQKRPNPARNPCKEFRKSHSSGMGKHNAYDNTGNRTGMTASGNDIKLGIPNSYYTGDYGGSTTPQVIVGYYTNDAEKIKEFRVCRLGSSSGCMPVAPRTHNTARYAQSLATTQTAQSSENISFNMSIEDQTETSNIEINFDNVTVIESSIATVNLSDPNNYHMDVDLNGNGTIDQIIYPDEISTIPLYPKNNIEVIAYNGAGVINISTSSGNISSAASLNESSLPIAWKPPVEFPYGTLAFKISDLSNGQTVDVTIAMPKNLSTNSQYWKYGETIDDTIPHWYQIPLGSNDGDNVITIPLQDGGIGDDDLIANGKIVGAGGPGVKL